MWMLFIIKPFLLLLEYAWFYAHVVIAILWKFCMRISTKIFQDIVNFFFGHISLAGCFVVMDDTSQIIFVVAVSHKNPHFDSFSQSAYNLCALYELEKKQWAETLASSICEASSLIVLSCICAFYLHLWSQTPPRNGTDVLLDVPWKA